MSEKETGGPAFPIIKNSFGGMIHKADGMTLRDWFAGMAAQGAASKFLNHDALAKHAYETADAMLKERGSNG